MSLLVNREQRNVPVTRAGRKVAVPCSAGFFALIMVLSGLPAQAGHAPIVIHPIDPAALATSSVDTDFAPEIAKHVKHVFATYLQDAIRSGTLSILSSPTEYATTVTGRTVDLKSVFVAINKLQASAEQSNLTLNTPALASKPVNLDRLQARVALAPNAAVILVPVTLEGRRPTTVPSAQPVAVASALPAPATAATCAPSNSSKALSLDESWSQIQALANSATSSTIVDRCNLAFEPQLTEAESGSPRLSSNGTVTLATLKYGGYYASAQFQDSVNYAFSSAANTLTLNSVLDGSFLGTRLPIVSINAVLTAPATANSSASVTVAIGQQATYKIDQAVNPNQSFHIAPVKPVSIIPPFRTSIKSLLSGSFEVDCVGSIGLDGTLRSNRYGLLIEAAPKVHVTLNGGISASYILIEGSLSGELTLVDLSGQIGALAAVIPDSTAPQFDDATFLPNHPPVVAIARPFASATMSALQGSVSIKLRIAGNYIVFSKTVPISGGVKAFSRTLPDTWNVTYLLPPT